VPRCTQALHPTLGLLDDDSQDIDDVSKFCSLGIDKPGPNKLEDTMVVVGRDLVNYARAVGLAALEEVGLRDAAMVAC